MYIYCNIIGFTQQCFDWKSSLFTCAEALNLVATEGVSNPPEATDPALQNTVNHVSVFIVGGHCVTSAM